MKQEEIRMLAKRLKWECNISYKDMAAAIGMSNNGFYNFISNKDIKLGYEKV